MKDKNGYGQFCPVAKAAEVLAVKWTPVIIRELMCGSYRFSDIKKGVPLMSPSLLSARLQDLEWAGILRRNPARKGKGFEYYLTEAGEALRPIIEMQGEWAQKWLEQDLQDKDLDPSLLMWDMHRNIDFDFIPQDRRFVVQFEFTGVPVKQRRWWLLMENQTVDVCLKDPGYEIDVFVSSSIRTMAEIWMGMLKIKDALRAGDLTLDGARDVCETFPKALKLSHFAPTAVLSRP
ncbi:MAG: helix-turn-helix transcriptional regulator [Rhodospirillaceae bacterium]|jgi:DNA-binding HxlR family transcriptional regulator|nr:helix-turn-helix transcriptional regulator [Rhodospirillaceae bacterium]MBT5243706.1 helix-turn-helix transcriptional regulator [Rhodospirillaceae bacterium]MBT5563803.1 helix-turn-helix transcriptional regulator [Rhodospirillaceae bacterium]MBT6241708.1 helix-turn-helix transcriptional regulator [Rhodospirillaceae bacterium]MBT7138198.1 helix-turn-helix transcriptional regulator [Rhodospirillaceae bacterium]